MSSYRFVHLSDIHFGQEQNGTAVLHNDVREQLLNDCSRMKNEIGSAHGILVAGDIAFSGKKEEYKRAGEWFDRLTEAVGCQKTAVHVVPGNHDVDLAKINHVANMIHEKLREGSPQTIQGDLEKITKSEEENVLLSKLRAYREFAAQYGCIFESSARPFWKKDFSLDKPYILRLLGLNSVQVSDKQDAIGNMILGNAQYTLESQSNVEYVVILHHPLEWFKDSDLAKTYLNSRARVIIVGHKHLPGINKVIDERNVEIIMIGSGATNPPETGGRYRYTYNWLEFSIRSEKEVQNLIIKVHPRVWVEDHTEFAPDHARLGGKNSREWSLVCPSFQVQSKEEHTNPPVSIAEPMEEMVEQGGTTMAYGTDERFERLRYFFWRYLDWRQRLNVLVQIDILPDTPDSPVPQTMERIALNTARNQKKLSNLWTAMMEYVPEEKREKNPFTPDKE